MNGITLNSLYDFVHSVGFCPHVPMFPVEKHIFLNRAYTQKNTKIIICVYMPYTREKLVGKWEQNPVGPVAIGFKAFPLNFKEWEYSKKGEQHGIST